MFNTGNFIKTKTNNLRFYNYKWTYRENVHDSCDSTNYCNFPSIQIITGIG